MIGQYMASGAPRSTQYPHLPCLRRDVTKSRDQASVNSRLTGTNAKGFVGGRGTTHRVDSEATASASDRINNGLRPTRFAYSIARDLIMAIPSSRKGQAD